eukprot:scaffold309084_cov19-Tisochrysis_lutea.AAC.3
MKRIDTECGGMLLKVIPQEEDEIPERTTTQMHAPFCARAGQWTNGSGHQDVKLFRDDAFQRVF